jgi:outer membrane protein assembly factor BamB
MRRGLNLTLFVGLLALTLVQMPVISCANEFSQFRGQDGSGRVTGQNIPGQWSESTNLAWKIPAPGSGWSQPVLWEKKLFVTAAVSDPPIKPKDFAGGVRMPQSMGMGGATAPPDVEIQWQVFCYDAFTGDLIWTQTVCEGKPEFPVHPSNTYATESPVVDADGLYAFFGATGVLAALDHDGSLRWLANLGAFPTNNGFGTGSSVAIDQGRVFVQHFTQKSSLLACFDSVSGEKLWQRDRATMGSSWSSPIIWRNKARVELIVSGGNLLESIDPQSGMEFWKVGNVKAPTACSVASDSERVYFGGSDPMSKGPMFAVRSGAAGDISPVNNNEAFDYCDWVEKRAAPGMASPVSSGEFLIVTDNNILRVYSCKDGEKLEERRLPIKTVAASPILVDSRLLVIDENGKSLLIECSPGFPIVGEGQLDDIFWSTPAIGHDSVYLRGVEWLYCLRAAQQ